MSAYYAKHGKPEVKKYKLHGKTKQSQKDETDINKLLERSARKGTLSHLEKYQPKYGDFRGYDFEKHQNIIANGQTIFEELPAETKREFEQSPQKFFEFVTDPQNSQDLVRLLPDIANQGSYFATLGDLSPAEQAAVSGSDGVAVASEPASANTSPPALEAQNTPLGDNVGASLDTPTS